MKKTFPLLSDLKNRAKELRKENPTLKLYQARDAAAKEFGYANFKNYQTASKVDITQYKSALEIILKNISLEDDISKKIELSILFLKNHGTPFRDSLNILKHLQDAEADIQGVCDKLNLMKNELQDYLLDDFLSDDGQSEIEQFYQYYRAKDITISNLVYSISKNELYIDGEYSLIIKFNGEVPEDYKNMPHFQEHRLWGSFDAIIDRNMSITLQDISIGEDRYRDTSFVHEKINYQVIGEEIVKRKQEAFNGFQKTFQKDKIYNEDDMAKKNEWVKKMDDAQNAWSQWLFTIRNQ